MGNGPMTEEEEFEEEGVVYIFDEGMMLLHLKIVLTFLIAASILGFLLGSLV